MLERQLFVDLEDKSQKVWFNELAKIAKIDLKSDEALSPEKVTNPVEVKPPTPLPPSENNPWDAPIIAPPPPASAAPAFEDEGNQLVINIDSKKQKREEIAVQGGRAAAVVDHNQIEFIDTRSKTPGVVA